MSRRSELRMAVMGRSAGRCEWTRCRDRGEELAHVNGLGRGGNPDGSRDHEGNVLWLCRYHHDLLDGRRPMKLWEVENLLLELIARRYSYPDAPLDLLS